MAWVYIFSDCTALFKMYCSQRVVWNLDINVKSSKLILVTFQLLREFIHLKQLTAGNKLPISSTGFSPNSSCLLSGLPAFSSTLFLNTELR